MTVVIVDYGSSNLRSAAKAFERGAVESGLSLKALLSSNPNDVRNASRIVLPGVGSFADCRAGLMALDGMIDVLNEAVIEKAMPFLGICVGMQLMGSVGLEHGIHMGLGWLNGTVRVLEPIDKTLKIPHMGWNELVLKSASHPVLEGLGNYPHVYFVHSYFLDCDSPKDVLATVDYGGSVTAMVARENMIGTQFHPEKSQHIGLRLIRNFLNWKP